MKKKIYESLELTADEGKVLTDGKHYCKAVLLDGTDDSVWSEIPEEDAPKAEEESEEEPEENI